MRRQDHGPCQRRGKSEHDPLTPGDDRYIRENHDQIERVLDQPQASRAEKMTGVAPLVRPELKRVPELEVPAPAPGLLKLRISMLDQLPGNISKRFARCALRMRDDNADLDC